MVRFQAQHISSCFYIPTHALQLHAILHHVDVCALHCAAPNKQSFLLILWIIHVVFVIEDIGVQIGHARIHFSIFVALQFLEEIIYFSLFDEIAQVVGILFSLTYIMSDFIGKFPCVLFCVEKIKDLNDVLPVKNGLFGSLDPRCSIAEDYNL